MAVTSCDPPPLMHSPYFVSGENLVTLLSGHVMSVIICVAMYTCIHPNCFDACVPLTL